MEKSLDLSPEDKALLSEIRTAKGHFSEILVHATGTHGVARLVPDRHSYWLSTTDPEDTLRLEALVQKHGSLAAAIEEISR